MKKLHILGTRGIPAHHGGYETFISHLAPFLYARGWEVTVYCQIDGSSSIWEDSWQGIRRVNVSTRGSDAISTVVFDWLSVAHLLQEQSPGVALTLGYNTAVFCSRLKAAGIPCLINMDGMEWKRDKWSFPARTWLWLNERAGCLFNDHLISDHPEISAHLATRAPSHKITMIPYGADEVSGAKPDVLKRYGLEPDQYLILIARPEPENSILEIVRAFCARPRDVKLVILGDYTQAASYRQQVRQNANADVIFPGAIYEPDNVAALRFFSRAYLHGHRVGGTNPSLVESLAAGCLIIAHDNRFNRWVAGEQALYFDSERACASCIEQLLSMPDDEIRTRRLASRKRHHDAFTWQRILNDYESLLLNWADKVSRR